MLTLALTLALALTLNPSPHLLRLAECVHGTADNDERGAALPVLAADVHGTRRLGLGLGLRVSVRVRGRGRGRVG